MSRPLRIAVLGGTFDPVHHGHLRSAVELREQLALDEVRLMPARKPPLRGEPGASAEQRLAMVEMAIQGEPGLTVDGRELHRSGPSYTVDTLAELRTELGRQAVLCFALGGDAFASLDRWHHWQRLLELAHLVVMQRPGADLPCTGAVAELLHRHRQRPDQLGQQPGGGIAVLEVTQLPIAATALRDSIAAGRSPRYLLPDSVWHHIRQHALYGHPGQGTTPHRGAETDAYDNHDSR